MRYVVGFISVLSYMPYAYVTTSYLFRMFTMLQRFCDIFFKCCTLYPATARVLIKARKSMTYHLACRLMSVRRRSLVSKRGRRNGESSWSVSSDVVLTDVRGISSGFSTDSRRLLQCRDGRPRHSDPRDFLVNIVDVERPLSG